MRHVFLALTLSMDTVADMSLDVGVGVRQGETVRFGRLREALSAPAETHAADRVLAELFWRPSVSQPRASTSARVLPFALRARPRT
jgi:hypothetical protein